MPVYLTDLPDGNRGATRDRGFHYYRDSPTVASLQWPEEVVRQWLYDHGRHVWFLQDYGAVDLSQVCWNLEDVSVTELENMPTGPSEERAPAEYAAHHQHYLSQRSLEIREAWESAGTWLVVACQEHGTTLSPVLP